MRRLPGEDHCSRCGVDPPDRHRHTRPLALAQPGQGQRERGEQGRALVQGRQRGRRPAAVAAADTAAAAVAAAEAAAAFVAGHGG